MGVILFPRNGAEAIIRRRLRTPTIKQKERIRNRVQFKNMVQEEVKEVQLKEEKNDPYRK